MNLDDNFSLELKDLIANSRNIATDLGYDYISTIHFFLADCESKRNDTIFGFCFKDENEYQSFKNAYKVEKENSIAFLNDSMPLTKEAEQTIRLSEVERKSQRLNLIFPNHLFIAALKNQDSLLYECFKAGENASENLQKYYDEIDKLTKNVTQVEQIIEKEKSNNNNFLNRIKRLFKLTK